MRKLLAIVLLAIAGSALGQSGNFPALVGQRGTTLPTNCTIGQLFFDTDATAGGNIYGCTSANTWTQMEGGSAITGCTYAANVLTCPTITATTKFLAPYGSAAAPAYSFSSDATTGIYGTAGNVLGFSTGGTFRAIMGTGALVLADTFQLGWSSDARISRYAAKQLMISGDGTGATTNAGWIIGYYGTTQESAMWSSVNTPSATNYTLWTGGGGNTILNATGSLFFSINNGTKATLSGTAGAGISLAAGTAADNAPRALSISQTWTDGTTDNIGIVGNFDMGATGTATGKLLSLQAGAAGTTEVFSVGYTGVTTALNVVLTQVAPAATDACTAGTFTVGTDYLYTCSASGAWKRVAVTGGY